jgi:hypothetical protein
MLKQNSSTSEKRKKEAQRSLEREVLFALRARKQPIKWEVLCAHFDRQPTAYSLASVLNELKAGYFIAVDGEQNVNITAIGLKRLEAGMF